MSISRKLDDLRAEVSVDIRPTRLRAAKSRDFPVVEAPRNRHVCWYSISTCNYSVTPENGVLRINFGMLAAGAAQMQRRQARVRCAKFPAARLRSRFFRQDRWRWK